MKQRINKSPEEGALNIVTEEQLNIFLDEVIGLAKAAGIPVSSKIEGISINDRAKARFGACKTKGRIVKKHYIEVSSEILVCEENIIKSIIAHEVLHTCPGCYNHGTLWKAYAGTMEALYGYKIKRVGTYKELGLDDKRSKEKTGYAIVCKDCGQRILRKRKSKVVANIENYKCGKCGGELYLEDNDTTSCG